jgi:uncharacterized delta-60 repeat protein
MFDLGLREGSIALQPEGKILLGGLFWAVNVYVRSSVARLNSDGSLDLGFNPFVTRQNGAVGIVDCVAWLSNGQIMIGGSFSYLYGVPITSLARLNSNGSMDFSFTPQYPSGVGSDQVVLALADNVGRYVVAGSGPAGIGFLTRLTYTGVLDPSFGTDTPPAANAILFNGAVRDLFIQGDGKIVVGGSCVQILDNNIPPAMRGHVARFTTNGTLDSSFTTTTGGANGDVYAVGQQAGGKILIGGNFTYCNGILRNQIA